MNKKESLLMCWNYVEAFVMMGLCMIASSIAWGYIPVEQHWLTRGEMIFLAEVTWIVWFVKYVLLVRRTNHMN